MTTVHTIERGGRRLATSRQRGRILRQSLLACGVLSSLLYATMLIVVPMRWDAYSSAAQTVTDALHIAFSVATVLLMMLAISGPSCCGSWCWASHSFGIGRHTTLTARDAD